jgi:hypothetical protein
VADDGKQQVDDSAAKCKRVRFEGDESTPATAASAQHLDTMYSNKNYWTLQDLPSDQAKELRQLIISWVEQSVKRLATWEATADEKDERELDSDTMSMGMTGRLTGAANFTELMAIAYRLRQINHYGTWGGERGWDLNGVSRAMEPNFTAQYDCMAEPVDKLQCYSYTFAELDDIEHEIISVSVRARCSNRSSMCDDSTD